MNRFQDVNKNLEILAEECAEVIQIKSKIVRFGLDDQHPTYAPNRARLEQELGHLIAMKDILVNQGIISNEAIEEGRLHKLEKLERWY